VFLVEWIKIMYPIQDGFDPRGRVSVIFATNRLNCLDPALIRPGRIDRLIEVPVPSRASLLQIFKIHTRKIHLASDVDATKLLQDSDGMSGADVRAMCTEASLRALRRLAHLSQFVKPQVTMEDFMESKVAVKRKATCAVEDSLIT
jgi:proteasome regulatory subunit